MHREPGNSLIREWRGVVAFATGNSFLNACDFPPIAYCVCCQTKFVRLYSKERSPREWLEVFWCQRRIRTGYLLVLNEML